MVVAALGTTRRERLVSFLASKLWLLGFFWLAPGHGVHAQATSSAHFTSSQRELPMVSQNPTGMAVDQEGNIYVVDQVTGTVTEDKLLADAYTSSVVLTGLKSPTAIAVDMQGNLYITEDARYQSGPTDVVKESVASDHPGGGYTKTVIPTAGLGLPAGIALDMSGAIYVADSQNDKIIKLTPSLSGYAQSALLTGALLQPSGVAVDAGGSVYIADTGHSRVLKEAVSGNGYSESVVTSPDFNYDYSPLGVAVDGLHNVYVLGDEGYSGTWVFKESPDGPTYTESLFLVARVPSPNAITADSHGFFYAVGPGNNQLTKVSAAAGNAGPANLFTPGLPISLVFTADNDGASVGSVAVTSQGMSLPLFTDAGSGSCRLYGGAVQPAGQSCSVDVIFQPNFPGVLGGVVTLNDPAGNSFASGYVYGTGLAPSVEFPATELVNFGAYAHPTGAAADINQHFYFTESATGTLWVAALGYHDGVSINAVATGLANPMSVAVDPTGAIYVGASNAIYKEVWSESTYTYVQTEVMSGLDHLTGITVDGSANLYLIASSSGDARKEIPRGKGGFQEMSLGYGIANPSGIAADIPGNVYITDARQGVLYKEAIQYDGSYKQGVVATGLDTPEGVAIDNVGNIYVAIPTAGKIYEYALQADGSYRQTVAVAGMPMVWGVAVGEYGNLYITQNSADGSAVIATVTDSPTLHFANTRVGLLSADSPKTVTLRNGGNEPLIFEDDDLGSNPVVPAGFMLSNESTCLALGGVLPQGQTCTYAVDFLPQVRMAYADNLTISDNDYDLYYLNYYSQQMIPVIGLGVLVDTTRTTMRISPDPVKTGLGVTMSIAVTDTTVSSAIPTGDVTVNDTVGSVTTTLNGGAPVSLSQGKAQLTTTLSLPGTHTITAHYNGVNKNLAGSTFALTLTVQR